MGLRELSVVEQRFRAVLEVQAGSLDRSRRTVRGDPTDGARVDAPI